jgi:ABC-type glutathione transport system ATPase component
VSADVLVLDEPTSALDARSEYEVFQRFRDLSAGTTTLLISHRFSTVRMADRIIILEGGEIIEAGTHHALLARGGRYAEMFELQAAGLSLIKKIARQHGGTPARPRFGVAPGSQRGCCSQGRTRIAFLLRGLDAVQHGRCRAAVNHENAESVISMS